jgi:perosamine synthetase
MIAHNKPTIGVEEQNALQRVMNSGFLSQGKEVEKFEDEFCKYLGLTKQHAVAVSSGTAALFLGLWALNSNKQKVVFPSYVCSAVRNAVALSGGKENIIDSGNNTPNMDLKKIDKKSEKIIIVPHMYGIPQKINKIKNIKFIEDCAQSLGSKINNTFAGLQGDLGTYSFYATKMITSGGSGGMVVSKNKEMIDKIRDYREFDYRHDKKLRFNFQMTELQAAFGRVQLKKLPKFITRREQIFRTYRKNGLDLLDIKQDEIKKIKPVRYRAIIKTNHQKKIFNMLKKAQIEARIPIENWELLGKGKNFKNAYELTKKTISLPIYPSLTNEEVEKILSVLA